MEREKWCGQMVLFLKVNGSTIRLVATVNFYMWMEISTKDSGPTTKLMEREHTLMLRAHAMRACGLMTNNMGKVLKPGQREPPTMESTHKVRRKERDTIFGQMVPATTGNG
jgi:hypothetical protein